MNDLEARLRSGIEKACILVEEAAKEKCPVDNGNLRRSITHKVTDSFECEVFSDLPYAPYVEYGTGLFAEDGKGRTDVPWRYQSDDGEWHTTLGQQPQPFLRPAVSENRDKIMEIVKTELMNGGLLND